MGEHEVTATSELHAQAEGTKKQKREEQAASSGGPDKDPERDGGFTKRRFDLLKGDLITKR